MKEYLIAHANETIRVLTQHLQFCLEVLDPKNNEYMKPDPDKLGNFVPKFSQPELDLCKETAALYQKEIDGWKNYVTGLSK